MADNISKFPESSEDDRAKKVRSILNDSVSEELAKEMYEAWQAWTHQNDSEDSDLTTDSEDSDESDDDDDVDPYRTQY